MLETTFHSRGMRLAALQQKPGDLASTPILALHGWLDNAESFRVLAEQMPHQHIISLDLPGHGLSDHRCESGTYNITDDLIDIANIIDQLGCDKIHLLGHSRGAMIATLFAAAFPEKVESLGLIDGLVPAPVEASDLPAQLNRHVRQYIADIKPSPRDSFESAVAVRIKNNHLEFSELEKMCRRGIISTDLGFVWRSDHRLMYSSSLKLSEACNRTILNALVCPVMLVLFSEGIGADSKVREQVLNINEHQLLEITACHHGHMQKQHAETIAASLIEFWANSVA